MRNVWMSWRSRWKFMYSQSTALTKNLTNVVSHFFNDLPTNRSLLAIWIRMPRSPAGESVERIMSGSERGSSATIRRVSGTSYIAVAAGGEAASGGSTRRLERPLRRSRFSGGYRVGWLHRCEGGAGFRLVGWLKHKS